MKYLAVWLTLLIVAVAANLTWAQSHKFPKASAAKKSAAPAPIDQVPIVKTETATFALG